MNFFLRDYFNNNKMIFFRFFYYQINYFNNQNQYRTQNVQNLAF